MSRKCQLTGKRVITGNNVSHAHNRTKRRFVPNLQETSLWSEALNKTVRVRVSASALRTVEHKGGIDAFLLDAKDADLAAEMVRVKKQVKKAQAAA